MEFIFGEKRIMLLIIDNYLFKFQKNLAEDMYKTKM